jgi:hypothetical protein
MDTMTKVDGQLGDGLRSHDRWVELKTKISGLPTGSGTPSDMFDTYNEVTGLVLALFDKVRAESKLIRDPDADAYYLEDGSAQELPESVVAAAQYAGRNLIASRAAVADKTDAQNAVTAARAELASNASDLSDDVKLAVEGTGSKTLGTNLLTQLDTYNQAIDTLIPTQAAATTRDTAQVNRDRDAVQLAAASLSTSILTQVDLLLKARLSTLDNKRTIALVTLVATVLLAIIPPLTVRRDRRGSGEPAPAGQRTAPSRTDATRNSVVEPEPWPSAETTAGRGSPAGADGDDRYQHRERFGASR